MERIQNRVVEDVNTPGTVLPSFDFSPISLSYFFPFAFL